jgi:hypothetical protein
MLENEECDRTSKIYSLTLTEGQFTASGGGGNDLLFAPRSQEGTRVKMSCIKS